MDAMEELSGSNDHTMIMKGKRTKRQRPMSPAGRVTSSSSTGGCGGEKSTGCSNGGDLYNSLVPSSSEISATSTEEDEDMANCLILLAQGGCSIKQEEEEVKMEKFSSSRRFNETLTTSSTAKAGFYVYECKTCNRTFPSFQALGGHRASHKKPKPMVEEKKVVAKVSVGQDEEEEEEEEEEDARQMIIRPNDPSHTMELSSKASHGNNKSKIHECSICGSEFSSGQALGGHMRRHRNPTNTKPTIDTNSTDHSPKKPSSNIFPLDLNLPAPEDHDHQDLKFQYSANQKHLVFSAPALVDCHY